MIYSPWGFIHSETNAHGGCARLYIRRTVKRYHMRLLRLAPFPQRCPSSWESASLVRSESKTPALIQQLHRLAQEPSNLSYQSYSVQFMRSQTPEHSNLRDSIFARQDSKSGVPFSGSGNRQPCAVCVPTRCVVRKSVEIDRGCAGRDPITTQHYSSSDCLNAELKEVH